MFSVLVILLLLVGGIFLVNVALQPAEFVIVRTALFHYTQGKIFEHVNNLRLWNAWSPWARMDPDSKTTYAGPAQGKGAVLKWNGNSKVGEGVMKITDSRPADFIQLELTFIRPFKATNMAEFQFEPQEGDKTLVTWRMSGVNNFVGKLMNQLMDCDKMVGGQFQQGFTNLGEVLKSQPQ